MLRELGTGYEESLEGKAERGAMSCLCYVLCYTSEMGAGEKGLHVLCSITVQGEG
jgi:hypothetical protein